MLKLPVHQLTVVFQDSELHILRNESPRQDLEFLPCLEIVKTSRYVFK
jgi:hypothetical protein